MLILLTSPATSHRSCAQFLLERFALISACFYISPLLHYTLFRAIGYYPFPLLETNNYTTRSHNFPTKMAGIIGGPLSIFRKSDTRKPLHARWGDVSISVPTDGSWSQYNNPHRPTNGRSAYGPGYIPDNSPDQTTPPLKEADDHDDARSVFSTASASSQRSSLGSMLRGRLSIRSASRPKNLKSESLDRLERDPRHSEQKNVEFAYRPIKYDYPSEVVENSKQPNNRFRYVRTSGRYLQASESISRSQSVSPRRSSCSRDRSCAKSCDRTDRARDHDSTPGVRISTYERPDSGYISDHSQRLSSRRRISPLIPVDRQSGPSSNPPITAMVPDHDELYE